MDLFCGLCGFTTGAAAAGMRPTLAIDTDAHALHYHRINHPTAKHAQLRLGPQSDDRLAELIRAHVPAGRAWHLHGSPPCQLFSWLRSVKKAILPSEGLKLVV